MLRYIIILICVVLTSVCDAQTIGGIGITLKLDTLADGATLPKVLAVADNSPAAGAGIKVGMYVLQVDEHTCRSVALEELVGYIRGTAGTAVKLIVTEQASAKKGKEYVMNRAVLQIVPPPDAPTQLANWSEAYCKTLKAKGYKIVRTVPSECGDYYFSFDAAEGDYYVRVLIAVDDAGNDPKASAQLYDNADESQQVQLAQQKPENGVTIKIMPLDGKIALKRNSVGVVSTELADVASCKGMYVIVYRQ